METIRYANAYDSQALATVIAGNPDGGEEILERAGKAEDPAKLYRWERCAEATLAAYRAGLADPR
jgi:hypothetical protein